MVLRKIVLENFKNFEGQHTFHFDKVNMIRGKNGSGKSTLIKDALLFAIYGHSEVSLENLPTRGKSKSCKVELHFENIVIKRDYPTKIFVQEVNYPPMMFANNKVAQDWLNNRFKNVEYFRKFRMIDVQQGINILEEGRTSLRKTLFSFNDKVFNEIRNSLQTKRRQRDIYNRDNLKLDKIHYPSEKRLHVINIGVLNITESIYDLEKEITEIGQELTNLNIKKSNLEITKDREKTEKHKILEYSTCPTCSREITESIKLHLVQKINYRIDAVNKKIPILLSKIEEENDEITHLRTVKRKSQEKKEKLIRIQAELENRVKQKDYKWTTKDVEIMKQAIKELDNFASYYITEWIKVLEPIINDIIKKVGFTIKFDLDDKGRIDIILYKGNEEYKYKDLSSGQRLIISIAFQMSLLMERGEAGLIIADEGFSNLDKDNLLTILELFKSSSFQLLSVIHRLDDIPDRVYLIALED
jgi:hypothetical protein